MLGCARPRQDAAFASLRAQGITVLVNLHKRPDNEVRLASFGMRHAHVPLADFAAPTPEQLTKATTAIDEAAARGDRVAVHRGGGLGRTGTILVGYRVHRGHGPDDAIARVRALRPGSIETTAPLAAIRAVAAGPTARDV